MAGANSSSCPAATKASAGDDDILSNFVQNFEKIPLRDENFEFPDLLGAAYVYLIKFFADSDPTCGSGGMLI